MLSSFFKFIKSLFLPRDPEIDQALTEIRESLPAQAWFGTTIINTYMNFICELNQQRKVASLLCGEFYVHNFFQRLVTGKKYKSKYQNLINADIILWPIEKAHHWYLIVIHKKEESFYIETLDGFNKRDHDFLWEKAEELLQCLYPNDDRIIMKERRAIPKQNNTADCGPKICYWAKQICEDLKEVEPDSSSIRKEIGTQLSTVPEHLLLNYGRPDLKAKPELGGIGYFVNSIRSIIRH